MYCVITFQNGTLITDATDTWITESVRWVNDLLGADAFYLMQFLWTFGLHLLCCIYPESLRLAMDSLSWIW